MADVDAFAANGKRGLGVDDAGQGRTKRMKPDSADPSSSMNGALPSERTTSRKKPTGKPRSAATSSDAPPLDTWTYTPGDLLPELSEHIGKQLQVMISARWLTILNDRVTERQVWGTDVYTDDSDVVAVLVHSDKLSLSDMPPTHDLLVTLRILESADKYASTNRKNMRSRLWPEAHDGCSIKVEKVDKVKAKKPEDPKEKERTREKLLKQRLKQKSASLDKLRSSKKDKSGGGEQLLGTSVVFSLSNDPCLKYTQNVVADRGTQPQAYTAYRFKNEVLYVETDTERYELALQKSDESGDFFRWSLVHNPQLMSIKLLAAVGVPLPADRVNMIEEDLKWTDISWSWDTVHIRDKRYQLLRAFWRPVSAHMLISMPQVEDDSAHGSASASA